MAFAPDCCCSRHMDRRPWAGPASDYPNLDEQVGLGLAHGTLSLSINVPCVYQVLCWTLAFSKQNLPPPCLLRTQSIDKYSSFTEDLG